MKNAVQYMVLGLLLVFANNDGYSQLFKGEIIGGVNRSQVDGDFQFRFKKTGFEGGVGVVAPIYKNWSLSLETLYSQKGSRQKKMFEDSLDGSYKLRLNYVSVPFMIQYTDRDVVSAGVGVSYNRLVFAEEYSDGYKIDSVSVLSNVFDHDDWQAFGDVRVRLYKNLILNARYSYSIDKIATRMMIDPENGRPKERDFYNNLWTFRLIYMINENRPEGNVRKKTKIDE
jgi:hypothetical protein